MKIFDKFTLSDKRNELVIRYTDCDNVKIRDAFALVKKPSKDLSLKGLKKS